MSATFPAHTPYDSRCNPSPLASTKHPLCPCSPIPHPFTSSDLSFPFFAPRLICFTCYILPEHWVTSLLFNPVWAPDPPSCSPSHVPLQDFLENFPHRTRPLPKGSPPLLQFPFTARLTQADPVLALSHVPSKNSQFPIHLHGPAGLPVPISHITSFGCGTPPVTQHPLLLVLRSYSSFHTLH